MRHLLAQRRLSLSRLSALEVQPVAFASSRSPLGLNARPRHSKIFLGGELLRCDSICCLWVAMVCCSFADSSAARRDASIFSNANFCEYSFDCDSICCLNADSCEAIWVFERCDFGIAFRGGIDKRLFHVRPAWRALRFLVDQLLDFGLKLGNFRLFFSKRRFYIGIGLLALRLLHLLPFFFLGRLRRLFALFKRRRKLRFKLRDTRLARGLGVLRLLFTFDTASAWLALVCCFILCLRAGRFPYRTPACEPDSTMCRRTHARLPGNLAAMGA